MFTLMFTDLLSSSWCHDDRFSSERPLQLQPVWVRREVCRTLSPIYNTGGMRWGLLMSSEGPPPPPPPLAAAPHHTDQEEMK